MSVVNNPQPDELIKNERCNNKELIKSEALDKCSDSELIKTAQEFLNAWTKGKGRKKPRVHLPDAPSWGGVHLTLAAKTSYDCGKLEAYFDLNLFFNRKPLSRIGYRYEDIPVLIKLLQGGLPFPVNHECWTSDSQRQTFWLFVYHQKLQDVEGFKDLDLTLSADELIKLLEEHEDFDDADYFDDEEFEEIKRDLL